MDTFKVSGKHHQWSTGFFILALAKNVIRHTPNILKTLSLDKPLHNLQQRYSDMIFVY